METKASNAKGGVPPNSLPMASEKNKNTRTAYSLLQYFGSEQLYATADGDGALFRSQTRNAGFCYAWN
jgi:hypothetical protein